jgi:hypothetical protein
MMLNFRFECNHCRNTKNITLHCNEIQAVCKTLPDAVKIPKQVIWTPENDHFNPFKEILIVMEQGTFDGSQSGLHHFYVRYNQSQQSKLSL